MLAWLQSTADVIIYYASAHVDRRTLHKSIDMAQQHIRISVYVLIDTSVRSSEVL